MPQSFSVSFPALTFPGNCEYPPGSWQLKYCTQDQPACMPAYAPDAFFSSIFGAADPTATVRNAGFLLAPFDFVPGTGHHYRCALRGTTTSSVCVCNMLHAIIPESFA
jgi:hypothetical protein